MIKNTPIRFERVGDSAIGTTRYSVVVNDCWLGYVWKASVVNRWYFTDCGSLGKCEARTRTEAAQILAGR